MASADEIIFTILSNDAGVKALVDGRIYPQTWPQGGLFPVVVYSEADHGEGTTLDGADGLNLSRMEVDAVAPTVGQAKQLGAVIRGLLHGWRGSISIEDSDDGSNGTEPPEPTIVVQGIFLDKNEDSPSLSEIEEQRLFVQRHDFNVHWVG